MFARAENIFYLFSTKYKEKCTVIADQSTELQI